MRGEIRTVSIIGSGNVAWHYERMLLSKGYDCKAFASRGELPKEVLASDLVILAVKDEAIALVAQRLKGMDGILVHTSGFVETTPLSVASENYGSLYPLQSLKKDRETDYSTLPLCVFGSTERVKTQLESLAKSLSTVVYSLSDSQRKSLHLAAVFANNFTNHLFGIAKEILNKEDIPFSILFPLIDTSVERAKRFNPFEVQTGPAIRRDEDIMRRHKERLGEKEREIYEAVSNNIMYRSSKKGE